jgi:hypothetical protein
MSPMVFGTGFARCSPLRLMSLSVGLGSIDGEASNQTTETS